MIGDTLMKTKNLNKKHNIDIIFVLLILYFTIFGICSNFIITGDDYYFANKSLSSFSDIRSIECNGRYLGNILEVLLVNFSLNNLNIVRTLFMTTGLFIIIILVAKSSTLNVKFNFLYSATLILIAPSNIYREVYSWTPGYINYLIPIIGVLISLHIFKHKQNTTIYCFITFLIGLSCQFFIEHMTIYTVVLSTFLLLINFILYHKINYTALSYFLSSIIGAIIMFSSANYNNLLSSNDKYRSTSFSDMSTFLNRFCSNLIEASRDIVLENYFITILLCILCIVILKYTRFKNIKKLFILKITNQIISLLIILYILFYHFIVKQSISLSKNIYIYFLHILVAFLFLFLLLSIIIFFITSSMYKYKMIFYIVSILVVSLPLLFVSPIGSRCFYISYIFLSILSLDLISYLLEILNIRISYLQYINIILLFIICIYIGDIYYSTKEIYNLRTKYILEQMNAKKTEITVPSFPYEKYIQNDTNEFLGTYYYYNKRNDIKFNFVDINEWNTLFNNNL